MHAESSEPAGSTTFYLPLLCGQIAPGLWAGFALCGCGRCYSRALVTFGHPTGPAVLAAVKAQMHAWAAQAEADAQALLHAAAMEISDG